MLCSKEMPCALSDNLPIGYKTTCRQKYIYRKLVSLNEEGRALTDSFRSVLSTTNSETLAPNCKTHSIKRYSPNTQKIHLPYQLL